MMKIGVINLNASVVGKASKQIGVPARFVHLLFENESVDS